MTATASSLKWEPLKKCVRLPYVAAFTAEQFARLREGLIPRTMDHKWFIYYLEPYLFLHRSSGRGPIYRVTLQRVYEGANVIEAECSKDFVDSNGVNYAAYLLDFVVSKILLGQQKPFLERPNPKRRWRL